MGDIRLWVFRALSHFAIGRIHTGPSEVYPKWSVPEGHQNSQPFSHSALFLEGLAPFSRHFFFALKMEPSLPEKNPDLITENCVYSYSDQTLACALATQHVSRKKGRVGKGLRVLVTLGYASLRVHFTWPSVNLPIEGTAQKKQGSTVWAVGKENWKTLFLYGAGTVTPHFHTHKCRFCQCISMGMHLFWQKSRMADRPTSKY